MHQTNIALITVATFTNTTGSFSGIAPSFNANIKARLAADNTCVTTWGSNPVAVNPAPGTPSNPVAG